MVGGIIFIIAGLISIISAFSKKLLSSSYKTKWMVRTFGMLATQIIIGVMGLIIIIIGVFLIL